MRENNNFNGDFGGDFVNGDKYIYNQPVSWADYKSTFLKNEMAIIKGKIWDLRLKKVIPLAWGFLGAILTIYCLITLVLPNIFSPNHNYLIIVYTVLFLGMGLPLLWLWLINKQDGQLLNTYKQDLEQIILILRRRGDI
ncbi:hypothetical protein [Acinetobacter bereziniae]|uniref:hypothetical protein n=1 Tax=Acinetobacter bereziniae TaxID=106648 RepID=UPI000EF6E646|nr:hypothetical protein [Acinetobacter bereziniae]